MTADSTKYKYYAFISYNSKDLSWGKRLQYKLEHYRMPATLCSERGWKSNPISPVFFAPSDIQPGGLTDEIKKRLREAKHLIVICSPNSAKSIWVGKEIEYFYELGRDKNIQFFIIDGIPNSGNPETECFNPVVKKLGLPEILGANIHEKIYHFPWLNRERAYVQLISKLLNVEFDSIWKRHRRLLLRNILLWTIGILAVLFSLITVWRSNQPVDVSVSIKEASIHNENLPPLHNAFVSLTIDKETKSDTVNSIDQSAIFTNIPHKAIGEKSRIRIICDGWKTVDTTVLLSKNVSIGISRNPHKYGDVVFKLFNANTEMGAGGIPVAIAGQESLSNSNGLVKLFIPLEKQNVRYRVECDKKLENDILTMPTNESTAIIIL